MKIVNNGVVQVDGQMHIERTAIGDGATINEPAPTPADDTATNKVSGDIDGNAIQVGTVQGDLHVARPDSP
jgi:hypothetical protein